MALDLLFPHFDELVRTPEDVQRLNEAILQLAVQGKLVPHDSDDEPASELLKRIETNGANSGQPQSGRTRMPTLTETKVDAIYELPDTWVSCRLGDVAEVIRGVSYEKHQAQSSPADGYMPILRANNIRNELNFDDLVYVPVDRIAPEQRLSEQDIVICMSSGSASLVGKSAILRLPFRGSFGAFCAVLRCKMSQLAPYVDLFMSSPSNRQFLTRTGRGIGINNLRVSDLLAAPFSLPPFAEQQRIVAKVDELFAQTRALEARLRQAQADVVTVNRAALHRLHSAQDDEQFQISWRTMRDHFDLLYDDPRTVAELRQAILDLAVRGKLVAQDPQDEPAEELLKRIQAEKTRLVKQGRIKKSSPLSQNRSDMTERLPEGWSWALVDDLCYVGTGSTPRRDEPDNYEDGRIPWITSAVTGMPFVSEASEYISERALAETNCQVYPKHTLIVGLYGQGKTRGQVSELLIEAATNQACAALVFDGFSDYVQPYVKLYFQKNYHELRKLAEGGAQPNLNVGKVRATALPIPPLAEQQRIVAKVDQLMRLCDELEAGLAQAETARRRATAAALAQA